MGKKYLVTGGTGFIGAYLVRRLVKDGHDVRVVDNDLRGARRRLDDVAGAVDLVECDVRDPEAMATAGGGMDAILHLAALNGTENFYTRSQLVLDIGIRGMWAVLESARINEIPHVVLASSSEVYQTPAVVPTPEAVPMMIPDPWEPRYSYGGSKLASELMLANYHRDIIKRAIIFRPHNVFGADMGKEHVIPQFALRALELVGAAADGVIDFPIQGDGTQTRSFIYIDDFIDALMLVVEKGEHRNVYHIGTMEELSMAELARRIVARLGAEARIVPGTAPAGATPRRCPDTTKLSALGFQPRVSLDEGLARTVDWYRDHVGM